MEENRRKVTLVVDRINSIVYEGVEEFESSILRDSYIRAFEITKEIVRSREELIQARGKNEKGSKLRNSEQIYNIISFTGDRGVGKTSAMLSFMEYLKDYYRLAPDPKIPKEFKFDDNNLMFTGLPYIDASFLESKEDILGTVLSKMAKKWKDEEKKGYKDGGIVQDGSYDRNKREIQMQFNRVFERLKDSRSERDIMDDDNDMFMETLEKLSFTANLKEDFQKLVEQYLNIMNYTGVGGNIDVQNHYLVIPIDDLDMDIQHSFRLIEQIRKYLMVPNVIILLSANYQQLENICKNHYSEQYKNITDENINEYIAKLSREYLEKMIPVHRQVLLQSGIKWKYFDKEPITIKYEDKEKEMNVENSLSLNKFVMRKYEELFGASFLEKSKNFFYIVPGTLRETVSWINQISSFRPLSEMDTMDLIETNFEWFWNEEFLRLCKKNLDFSNSMTFQAMEQLRTKGQKKLFKKLCQDPKNNPDNPGVKEMNSILEIISEFQQGLLKEQQIAAVGTIYFTMKISEIMAKSSQDEMYLKELLYYFNRGIWGEWEKKFIQCMDKVKDDEGAKGNFLKADRIRISEIEFNVTNEALSLQLDLKKNYEEMSNQEICAMIKDNSEKIKNYQYLLLFYRFEKNLAQFKGKVWKYNSNNKEIVLKSEQRGVFSLSNFVINILDNCGLVKEFVDELPKILCKKKRGDSNSINTITKEVNECSILNKVEKMKDKFVLPLNNIDYLVDTGIRIQESLGETAVLEASYENISTAVKQYFGILEDSLKDYGKNKQGENWSERFSNNPVVKKIKDEKFLKMLSHSINCLAEVDDEFIL